MPKVFTSIEDEKRTTITTSEAAYHLNLTDQTLRIWSSKKTGLIQPIKIGGRLHWKIEDIKNLLNSKK